MLYAKLSAVPPVGADVTVGAPGEAIAQTVPAVPAQPPDELKPRWATALVTSVLPGLPLLGDSGSVVVTLFLWRVLPVGALIAAPPDTLGAALP